MFRYHPLRRDEEKVAIASYKSWQKGFNPAFMDKSD